MLLSAQNVMQAPPASGNPPKKEMTEAQRAKELERAKKKLAKEEAKAAKRKAETALDKATEKDVVYMFGVGTNFNDSVVYVTEIIPVSYMKLEKKTKFLPYRAEFSIQLKQYLEGTLGLTNETTCMFFDDNRKKLAKRFYKLKKRYLDLGVTDLNVIDRAKFEFKKPEIDNVAL